MEILPILSAIILVGTVATLILAVAAYVLYKIRERQKARLAVSRPSQAEQIHLLTAAANGYASHGAQRALPAHRPFELNDLQQPAAGGQFARAATYVPPRHLRPAAEAPEAPAAPAFWEYTADGYRPLPARAEQPSGDGFAWL